MPKGKRGKTSKSPAVAPYSPAESNRASRASRRSEAQCEFQELEDTPRKSSKKSKQEKPAVKDTPKVQETPKVKDIPKVEEKPANVEVQESSSETSTNEESAETSAKEGDAEGDDKDDEDKEDDDKKAKEKSEDKPKEINGTAEGSGDNTESTETSDKEDLVITGEKIAEEPKAEEKEVEVISEDGKKDDDDVTVINDDDSKMETDEITEVPTTNKSDKTAKPLAIVTGAFRGIGAAICRSLVGAGMVVAGLARRADKIKELAADLSEGPGSLHAFECDISKESQVSEAFEKATSAHGPVHICINNAGFSSSNPLLGGSVEEWRAMLDVNVVALCQLTQLSVNNMKKHQTAGHIIHISSMSGHRVVASSHGTNFYSATKFAVRALTDGLRNELRAADSPIRISCVSPGIVETEFAETMNGADAANKLYSSLKPLTARDVADTVTHLINAPSHVEITDVLMRPTEQKT